MQGDAFIRMTAGIMSLIIHQFTAESQSMSKGRRDPRKSTRSDPDGVTHQLTKSNVTVSHTFLCAHYTRNNELPLLRTFC